MDGPAASKPAGYTLDTGPTVLTMPGLLADAFAAVGADMADFCTIKPVDPMYRAVFADGSVLRVWHGRERMTQEIAEVAGAKDAAAFGRFCDWLAELYRVEMAHFIDTNYDSVLDLARPLGPALQLLRLGGFRKLANVVRLVLRRRAPAAHLHASSRCTPASPPTRRWPCTPSSPTWTRSRACSCPRAACTPWPPGLAAAVEKAGATFRYEQPVERILRAPGPRPGPRGRGRCRAASDRRALIDADAVVCNADLPVAYRTLLDGVEAPRAARRGTYSPSLLPVGGRRAGPAAGEAAHHNIHFGEAWDGAFKALIHDGPAACPTRRSS